MAPYLALGILLLFLLGCLLFWWLERRRGRLLGSTATSMGYTFSRTADDALGATLAAFPILSWNDDASLSNVLRGVDREVEVTVFDHQRSGEAHNSEQTVVLLEAASLDLPAFTIAPGQGVLRQAIRAGLSARGFRELTPESHPDLATSHVFLGAEETRLRDRLDARVLDQLERNPKWTIEGSGNRLAIHEAARRLRPHEVQAFVEDSLALLEDLQPR